MDKTIDRDDPLLVEKQYFTFAEPPNEMVLESGERFGPVTLAYETLGELSPQKDNLILILHALTGDSHVAGRYSQADERGGWWDIMVGPGKAIDTDRFFVVCTNVLGGCMGSTGPASTDPATGKPYGMTFPVVTIPDMVAAQKALMDHLGITRILCLVGGSMGGMQVLEWCGRYPDMVAAAIPMASTTKHSAQAIAFNETARQSIMSDPKWNGGNYYGGGRPDMGLAVARMIGHITYLSDDSMRIKFDRGLQNRESLSFDFEVDFQVESYLRHQGKKFVDRFDANAFLYITKATDYFHLERQHDASPTLKRVAGAGIRFLVISFTSDWLYPTYQSKVMVKAMKRHGIDVSFCEIEAEWGHDAFLLPSDHLSTLMKGFLNRAYCQK